MGSMVSVGLAKPKRSASRELTSLALSEAVIVCARVALLRLASSPAVISWRWAVSIVEFIVWARMGRQMGSNRWRMHGILLRASTVESGARPELHKGRSNTRYTGRIGRYRRDLTRASWRGCASSRRLGRPLPRSCREAQVAGRSGGVLSRKIAIVFRERFVNGLMRQRIS